MKQIPDMKLVVDLNEQYIYRYVVLVFFIAVFIFSFEHVKKKEKKKGNFTEKYISEPHIDLVVY